MPLWRAFPGWEYRTIFLRNGNALLQGRPEVGPNGKKHYRGGWISVESDSYKAIEDFIADEDDKRMKSKKVQKEIDDAIADFILMQNQDLSRARETRSAEAAAARAVAEEEDRKRREVQNKIEHEAALEAGHAESAVTSGDVSRAMAATNPQGRKYLSGVSDIRLPSPRAGPIPPSVAEREYHMEFLLRGGRHGKWFPKLTETWPFEIRHDLLWHDRFDFGEDKLLRTMKAKSFVFLRNNKLLERWKEYLRWRGSHRHPSLRNAGDNYVVHFTHLMTRANINTKVEYYDVFKRKMTKAR